MPPKTRLSLKQQRYGAQREPPLPPPAVEAVYQRLRDYMDTQLAVEKAIEKYAWEDPASALVVVSQTTAYLEGVLRGIQSLSA